MNSMASELMHVQWALAKHVWATIEVPDRYFEHIAAWQQKDMSCADAALVSVRKMGDELT